MSIEMDVGVGLAVGGIPADGGIHAEGVVVPQVYKVRALIKVKIYERAKCTSLDIMGSIIVTYLTY